jgi:hypothetical protein
LDKFKAAAKGQPTRTHFAVDPTKLLPKATFADPTKVPYPPIITAITDAIQDARRTAVANNKNVALVAAEVTNSKAYTGITSQLRLSDTETHRNNFVRGVLVGTPFTFVTLDSVKIYKPNGKFHGSYNNGVDFDTMFQRATTATSKQKHDLEGEMAKYRETDVEFKEHNNVIESFNGATAMLSTDIGTCNAARKRDIFWLEEAGASPAMGMGSSGLLELRDAGVVWSSDDPNQRHLKGLKIVFKEISVAAIRVMSTNRFI